MNRSTRKPVHTETVPRTSGAALVRGAYPELVSLGCVDAFTVVGRSKLKVNEGRDRSARFQRLKLRYVELLSSFAFNFNFRLFPVLAGSDLPPCFRWCVEVVTDNAIDAARLTVGGAG